MGYLFFSWPLHFVAEISARTRELIGEHSGENAVDAVWEMWVHSMFRDEYVTIFFARIIWLIFIIYVVDKASSDARLAGKKTRTPCGNYQEAATALSAQSPAT